ncbi:hypothetical protein DICVIV_05822 [Dictyocaulus viviparus]|uniref:Uncharacterized protein n=1 Tax=Dictyocaulus viviparus TaxID=29172 RepID=A0A0D8XWB3_DICVI|nr:hypothetical protein DICVIV_05822 [Dictyocaulus viviparus]
MNHTATVSKPRLDLYRRKVHRQMGLEENTRIPVSYINRIALDNVRISVRTEVEKGIKISDGKKPVSKSFFRR